MASPPSAGSRRASPSSPPLPSSPPPSSSPPAWGSYLTSSLKRMAPNVGSAEQVAQRMAESGELYSTFGSIAISMVDLILHLSVAIWVRVEHYEASQEPLLWLAIIFALIANLFSIVTYIAKNVGGEPPATGPPQLTELQQKLHERPEECVALMMLGLTNTEWLCFLTADEHAHTSFRKMAMLSNLIEGVPTLLLYISFLYDYDWSGLITASFVWTVATLVVKLLKSWIIFLSSSCERPPALDFGRNLRQEDLFAFLAYVLHFLGILFFLIFTDYAAHMPFFAQDWLLLQIGSTLGLSLNATLSNATLTSPSLLASIHTRAGFNSSNLTLASYLDDLTIETFVRRVLLTDASAREEDSALLTPPALLLLGEWEELRSTLGACYVGAVIFFVGGILFNLGLLTFYMRKPSYSSSFVTQRLWRSSMSSSLISTLGLANSGFLNALTQDQRGYCIVRRDSAASHVLLHGIPLITASAAALSALDCSSRPCGVQMRGWTDEFFCLFCLCLSVMLVWWHLTIWLVYRVPLPPPLDDDPDVDREALAILEPKMASGEWAALSLGMAVGGSLLLWLCELLCVLGFYWNTPSLTRPAYLSQLISFSNAERAFDWGFDFEDGSFQTVLSFWALSMLLNLLLVGLYLRFLSSQTLRRQMHATPVLSVLAISLSSVHPEALNIIADRHSDVCYLRSLALPCICLCHFPLAIRIGLAAGDHPDNGLLLFTLLVNVLYSFLFGMRALAVGLAMWHRRPGTVRERCLGGGECACLLVGGVQFILLLLTSVLYLQAKHDGGCCLPQGERDLLFACFVGIQMDLGCYALTNWLLALSFLNHSRFSSRVVVDRSYRSAGVLTLTTLDVSWLTLLAQDESSAAAVRRAGMWASLLYLSPALLLQLFVVCGVDWRRLDDQPGFLAPTGLSGASFTFTLVLTLWRMLMCFISRATSSQLTPSPYTHALPCCWAQWIRNRTPEEGWGEGGDGLATPALPSQPRAAEGSREAGSEVGSGQAEGELAEYTKDYYTVTNTSVSTGYTEYQEGEYMATQMEDEPPVELLSASCLQRALFLTPDGFQGIFIALPTSEAQPVPFLFVQVFDITPIRKRFGSTRSAQVSFRYNPVDAGGLDPDFIQHNVYNDPGTAWRLLQDLDFGEGAGGEGFQEGYSQAQIPEEQPGQLERFNSDPKMTPRTIAAQRL